MGPVLQYFLELIRRYHLDDRSAEVRNFLRFAERKPVSESIARAFLYRIQDLVTEQERRPNLLHRMPAFEEILLAASRQSNRELRVLEYRGQGPDHPMLLSMPETRYLKVIVAQVQ